MGLPDFYHTKTQYTNIVALQYFDPNSSPGSYTVFDYTGRGIILWGRLHFNRVITPFVTGDTISIYIDGLLMVSLQFLEFRLYPWTANTNFVYTCLYRYNKEIYLNFEKGIVFNTSFKLVYDQVAAIGTIALCRVKLGIS